MKKFLAIILALAMVFSLVACGSKTDAPADDGAAEAAGDVYKIGVVLPMSGGSARMGELQYEGFKLFAEYYNGQGGIKSLNGAQIELVLADSTGDPSTGGSETERLINNEKVDALVGPYNSSVGAVMQPIAEKYGVPLSISNCTADNVQMSDGELKYTFRPNHSNSSNVQVLIDCVKFLAEKDSSIDMNSFALIYENTDWGKSCVDTYAAAFVANGIDMKVCESFESGSADFSAIVNKVKSANVGFIMPVMYVSDAVLFMNQYTEYGLTNPLIWAGGGILTDDFVESVGDLAENQISLNGWCVDTMADSANPELCDWLAERCKEDTNSGLNENVANGWIAIATLIQAVEDAGTKDKAAVAAAMGQLDLGHDSLALLLHAYKGIKLGEKETWDGAGMMQNQNIYSSGIMTQIIDKEYRQVYPDWSNNPLVWPVA